MRPFAVQSPIPDPDQYGFHEVCCSACGHPSLLQVPDPLPIDTAFCCSACGVRHWLVQADPERLITIAAVLDDGPEAEEESPELPPLRLHPSDQPAAPPPASPAPPWPTPADGTLEGAREALRRAWEAPPVPQPWAPPRPCLMGAEKRSLSDWARSGLKLLPDLEPATVAASFRRYFGGLEPTKRGPVNVYSKRELSLLWLLQHPGSD